MKRLLPWFLLLLVVAWAAPAAAAPFELQRMVTAEMVEEREPVGVAEQFAADQAKVYAFIEARGITADTEVVFVWFHNDREVVQVPLEVRQGNRWRTFSSITLAGRRGDWRVELHDQQGELLKKREFTVH
ncbi:MAG: DUF2914 domain-containing protein [Desulfurivibrio sp.]|nr:DUF2914 domain-containing protein [Desulfurivibrio sp.]